MGELKSRPNVQAHASLFRGQRAPHAPWRKREDTQGLRRIARKKWFPDYRKRSGTRGGTREVLRSNRASSSSGKRNRKLKKPAQLRRERDYRHLNLFHPRDFEASLAECFHVKARSSGGWSSGRVVFPLTQWRHSPSSRTGLEWREPCSSRKNEKGTRRTVMRMVTRLSEHARSSARTRVRTRARSTHAGTHVRTHTLGDP